MSITYRVTVTRTDTTPGVRWHLKHLFQDESRSSVVSAEITEAQVAKIQRIVQGPDALDARGHKLGNRAHPKRKVVEPAIVTRADLDERNALPGVVLDRFGTPHFVNGPQPQEEPKETA